MNEPPLTLKQHARVRHAAHVAEEEAEQIKRRYTTLVDRDDLRSIGTLALYECARLFDETVGVVFSTYARLRVRGAMMRHVKCESRQRRVVHEIRIASAELMAGYADDFDILRHSREEFQHRIDLMCERHAAAMFLAAAEQARLESESDVDAAREYAHAIAGLAEVVAPLDEGDRRLLDLIYASRFNLDEAARDLGVVRKTAWRRLHRVLDQLRLALIALEVTRAPPRASPAATIVQLRPVLSDRGPPPRPANQGTSTIEARHEPSTDPGKQR